MSTFDNAPPVDGFALPDRYHCGQYDHKRDCGVCGLDTVTHPQVEPDVWLGEN